MISKLVKDGYKNFLKEGLNYLKLTQRTEKQVTKILHLMKGIQALK